VEVWAKWVIIHLIEKEKQTITRGHVI